MLEALKSLYITGFSSPWRKARPSAAPWAILILVNHGSEIEYPAFVRSNIRTIITCFFPLHMQDFCEIWTGITSEKLVFQVASGHVFVNKKPMLVLAAISD